MKSLKKRIVIGVAVFIFSLMQIESFAGEEWQRITQLPTKRWEFSTAVVEDKIYLIGGSLFENHAGPFGLSTVEIYDTQTNAWQRGADIPTPRTNAKAAVVDGTIYVFGGYNSKDKFLQNWKMADHVEAYDPRDRYMDPEKEDADFSFLLRAGCGCWKSLSHWREQQGWVRDRSNGWTALTFMILPRICGRRVPKCRPGAILGVWRLSAIGFMSLAEKDGHSLKSWGAGEFLGSIEEHDPINRQWQKKKDLLELKNWFSSVVVEDAIYLIGGYTREGGLREVATVNVYYPRTETWREITALPNPLGAF